MPLTYTPASSAADAATQLAGVARSRAIGGGTDLLVAMEAGLDGAGTLVDLTKAADLATIEATDGGVRIGGAARLDDVARHPLVRDRFPALALACESVATPAIRSMGTVGGNLCQRPRCWYLRQRIPCHKNGGAGCPAVEGENQYHAIFGDGPCHAAHPSDLAVALLALDATLVVRGATGTRTLSIDALYANAAHDAASEVTLGPGEFVEAVLLGSASAGGTQRFTKLMQRGAWDFALVSLAAVKRADGQVRLALGGVAPAPMRVSHSVEEDVASGGLDADSADALAERAMYDAAPLSANGYKVQQATALLRRAMLDLSAA
jgi:xanthine dehydrogenase YagS FAD-binding subunit